MKLGLSCNKRNVKYLNLVFLDSIEHFIIGWLAKILLHLSKQTNSGNS